MFQDVSPPIAGVVTRRQIVVSTALTMPLALAGCGGSEASADELRVEAALASDAPTLYYVTAPDCEWCRWWANSDEPGFRKSPARSKLKFVTVQASAIKTRLDDATWPDAIRWVRDAYRKQPNARTAIPLFILVRNHHVIIGASGNEAWKTVMLPGIARETGTA